MVLRNELGEFVTGHVKTQAGLVSPKEAEALGLLQAMKWVCCMGWVNVVFELDAKCVVDSVQGKRSEVTEYGSVITSCRQMSYITIFLSSLCIDKLIE
ncbi:hypothetical protein PTKIN_Ptkin06aG0107400 [Pterospermum kingtungense]